MAPGNDLRRRIFVGTHDGVCAVNTSDGGMTWTRGNITPLANAAARLSVSLVDPDRAYLAAYEAGVYKTNDGGVTWRHLASYPTDYAHSVLAHPEQPGVLFVGSEPAAVFRSDDEGESWSECSGFHQANDANQWTFHGDRLSHVRELRIAPGNANTMFAGVEVGGVIKSTDGGKRWSQLDGLNDDIHWVDISPANPQRIYVATAQAPYRSDDGGQNWELINNELERRYTLHISAAPHDASLVVVAVSTNARRDNPQFYRSVDAGNHWELIDSVGQGENPEDMVVTIDWDPVIRNRVYAGTDCGKIHRSDDGGRRWEALDMDLPRIAVGAMVVSAPSS